MIAPIRCIFRALPNNYDGNIFAKRLHHKYFIYLRIDLCIEKEKVFGYKAEI